MLNQQFLAIFCPFVFGSPINLTQTNWLIIVFNLSNEKFDMKLKTKSCIPMTHM